MDSIMAQNPPNMTGKASGREQNTKAQESRKAQLRRERNRRYYEKRKAARLEEESTTASGWFKQLISLSKAV